MINPYSWLASKYGRIWAIEDTAFEALGSLDLEREIDAHLFAETNAAAPRVPSVKGQIAVMPLTGTITQRGGGFFSNTSTDAFGQAFDSMMADAGVGAIVLDVDSGGGSVYGVEELATKIRSAREIKPIIAVANSSAFSAAYWIATAADKLFVSPSGEVGSIGVRLMHVDWSEQLAAEGIKVTHIHAGKYKVEGNAEEPLSDEAREEFQAEVDMYHGMFLRAVAKGRGVTPKVVESTYGQGRIVGALEAVKRGMADGVATMDDVIGKLTAVRATARRDADARRRIAEARLR